MASQELILLYMIFGGIVGIIYALRRIYFLEQSIADLHAKVGKLGKKR